MVEPQMRQMDQMGDTERLTSLEYASQRRRRAMSIECRVAGTSSVGAAPTWHLALMSLLRSLATFTARFYRHGAPTALGSSPVCYGATFQDPIRAVRAICGSSIREICGNTRHIHLLRS